MKKFTILFLGLNYLNHSNEKIRSKKTRQLIAFSLVDLLCIVGAVVLSQMHSKNSASMNTEMMQLIPAWIFLIVAGLNSDKYELNDSFGILKTMSKYIFATTISFVLTAAIHFLISSTPIDKNLMLTFFAFGLLVQCTICIITKTRHIVQLAFISTIHKIQHSFNHSQLTFK